MVKCYKCGKEFEGRADAKYCSIKCRVSAKRAGEPITEADVLKAREKLGKPDSLKDVKEDDPTTITVAREDVPLVKKIMAEKSVKDLSREELYDAIGAYEKDEWSRSPEYQELLDRIEKMTVEQLRDGGYSVPARKANEGKVVAVEKKKWGTKRKT